MSHAVLTIQKHYRASVIGQKQRQEYLQLRNSVVLLQAIWRGKTVRKTIQKKHNLATIIQSYYRMYVNQLKYRKLRQATLVIQKYFRAYCMKKAQRAAYLKTKAAVLVLQSAYHGMTVRKRLNKLNKAATTIQAAFKSYLVRKDYERLRSAAIAVQRHYRAIINAKRQKQNYLSLKKATNKIQAIYRGIRVRRQVQHMHQAAICIQAMFKMVRRRIEQMRLAASTIQSAYRMHRNRRSYQITRNGAIVIQSYYRSYIKGKNQRKKYLTMKNSALVIQASYRGMKERQKLKIMHDSATVIQSSYRMYTQHRYYKQLCWAVRVIQQRFRTKMWLQSFLKMHVERRCLLEKKAAAIMIQSMFRCQRARTRYKLIRSAAVAIQRWYRACHRACLQKAEFSAQRQAIVIIQSAFRGMKARKIARRVRAARKIQSFLQMAVQRRKFIQLRTAAITLRAYYLMHKYKSQYASYKKAAVVLQGCYRSYLIVKSERTTYLQTRRKIIIVQARVRGFIEKKRFHKMKESTIKIQASYRGYKARQWANKMRAARVIQAWFRGCRARREYASLMKAVCVIQSHFKTKQQSTWFLKMRSCVLIIQRRWRATLTARMIQRHFLKLQAACLIQKACRGFKARRKFVQQNTAAAITQKHLRAWKEGRLQFMKYSETRRAVIKLQTFIWAYLVRKKEQKQKKRLLYFTAAAYHHICAIKIQRAYRIHLILKLAQNQISSVLVIQRWLRAKMQQKRFRRDYQRIIQLQRVIRGWLKHRNDAAAIIQRNVLRFLACRRRRKFAIGIIKFQALWRGYAWRKNNDTPKTRAIRHSLEKANENSREENKLCNRTATAIEYLLKYKHISYILGALKHLEVATRLSPLCCENMAQSRAIFTIFVLIRSCNRSVPCMDVIRYSVQVLLNVSKHEKTTHAVYEVENSVDTLLDLLQMYRGKAGDKILEKGGSIFTKTCCLLAILSKDSKRALEIRSIPRTVACIQSLYKLTVRKHRMDEERILVKKKTSTLFSKTSSVCVPVTPLRIKTVSRIKPDWILRKDNMQEIVDPLEAILMVMDTLGIAHY
uniref:Uncharacterized protein n=1 Tax=Melopsittacus undulatus TaxID=13146 RepID=A0A8C6JGW8_MELUD